MLEDVLLAELEKHGDAVAPSQRHIIQLAREVAKSSKETKQTLAAITGMYVKTFYELDDIKRASR